MKMTIKVVSLLSLVACLVLPVLFFVGSLGESALKVSFLLASVVWFVGAIMWGRKPVSV